MVQLSMLMEDDISDFCFELHTFMCCENAESDNVPECLVCKPTPQPDAKKG